MRTLDPGQWSFAYLVGAVKVLLNPDGKHLYLSSPENPSLKIVEVDDPSHQREIDAHDEGICDVALSKEGDALVTCSSDCQVKHWRLPTCLQSTLILRLACPINAVHYSPCGEWVACVNPHDIRQVKAADLSGRRILSVQFEPQSRLLVCLTDDGVVSLFDLLPEGLSRTREIHLAALLEPPRSATRLWSPALRPAIATGGGAYLVSHASSYFCLETASWSAHRVQQDWHVTCLSHSPCGRYLACAYESGQVKVFSASAPPRELAALDAQAVITGMAWDVVVTRGMRIFLGNQQGKYAVWGGIDLEVVAPEQTEMPEQTEVPAPEQPDATWRPPRHTPAILRVNESPADAPRRILCWNDVGNVTIYLDRAMGSSLLQIRHTSDAAAPPPETPPMATLHDFLAAAPTAIGPRRRDKSITRSFHVMMAALSPVGVFLAGRAFDAGPADDPSSCAPAGPATRLSYHDLDAAADPDECPNWSTAGDGSGAGEAIAAIAATRVLLIAATADGYLRLFRPSGLLVHVLQAFEHPVRGLVSDGVARIAALVAGPHGATLHVYRCGSPLYGARHLDLIARAALPGPLSGGGLSRVAWIGFSRAGQPAIYVPTLEHAVYLMSGCVPGTWVPARIDQTAARDVRRLLRHARIWPLAIDDAQGLSFVSFPATDRAPNPLRLPVPQTAPLAVAGLTAIKLDASRDARAAAEAIAAAQGTAILRAEALKWMADDRDGGPQDVALRRRFDEALDAILDGLREQDLASSRRLRDVSEAASSVIAPDVQRAWRRRRPLSSDLTPAGDTSSSKKTREVR